MAVRFRPSAPTKNKETAAALYTKKLVQAVIAAPIKTEQELLSLVLAAGCDSYVPDGQRHPIVGAIIGETPTVEGIIAKDAKNRLEALKRDIDKVLALAIFPNY